jgi:hypothetical protein
LTSTCCSWSTSLSTKHGSEGMTMRMEGRAVKITKGENNYDGKID